MINTRGDTNIIESDIIKHVLLLCMKCYHELPGRTCLALF